MTINSADEKLKKLILMFIILKAVLFGVGIVSSLYMDVGNNYFLADENLFLNQWSQFDGKEYLSIADIGATDRTSPWFPLYPWLVDVVKIVLGNTALSAILVANIISIFLIYYLFRLAVMYIGEEKAYSAVKYFIFFPVAFYLSSAYSEALFIMTSVAAFYYAKQNRWFLACLFGGFSAMTRIIGVFIGFPLLYYYLKSHKVLFHDKYIFDVKKFNIDLIYFTLIPLGLMTVMFYYLHYLGNPLAFISGHSSWGREISWPFHSVLAEINNLIFSNVTFIMKAYYAFNIILTIIFLYLLIYSYKKLDMELFIFAFFAYLIPVAQNILLSISRYLFQIFPLFFVLPMLIKNKKIENSLLTTAFIVQIVFTIRHVNGGFYFE